MSVKTPATSARKTFEVRYGNYLIKARPSVDGADGAVFMGSARLCLVTGLSQDEVISEAKRFIDNRQSSRLAARRLIPHQPQSFNIGTTEEYAEFLARQSFPDFQLSMLKAHVRSPSKSTTFGELGIAASWKGDEPYEAANLWYGRLGKQVADYLSLQLPKREDGSTIAIYALGYDAPDLDRSSDNYRYRLTMHPELAEALNQLGMG
ncbi:hypothetical protein NGM99_12050 [Mesorhizobium sp. RP14(2022)]|uniref:Uncharacterized protein n=1 Tax=Mesorhizobium liriopis TaxID=2953882 RepID=A0ABT1C7Q4_9HYPH|nr:hypothetical protein [Mesorhizobium liriopis]MCO6050513.1 hypothetical protein [Mesorhizobium liriopis]